MFCGYAVDDGAGEVSEEEVAGDGFVKHVEGDPVALHAGFGAGGGDEAGVVGVVVVDVDDSVDALVDEMCEKELHVSSFVSAECEARSVVAFDEELRDGAFVGIWVGVHRIGDGGSESRHFLEGGVEARQFDAWEGVDAVENGLGLHILSALTPLDSRLRGNDVSCAKLGEEEENQFGCHSHNSSAKANVWGWPPEWMNTTGTSGSRFPARISPIKADIDLPV